MTKLAQNLFLFISVMFTSLYWHLWYKLGPSIIKDIVKRIKGKKEQLAKIKNLEIEKFLEKLNYKDFYVIKSPIAFGVAHPFSKEVVISSKIYESGNFNLIKYVLAHEIAHKRQGNTKAGVFYFIFCTVCFLLFYFCFHSAVLFIIFLAILLGRIAFYGQRKFEDLADKEAARIIGKNNFLKAIRDLFILNGTSLGKGGFWKEKLLFSRDLPGRIKSIETISENK